MSARLIDEISKIEAGGHLCLFYEEDVGDTIRKLFHAALWALILRERRTIKLIWDGLPCPRPGWRYAGGGRRTQPVESILGVGWQIEVRQPLCARLKNWGDHLLPRVGD